MREIGKKINKNNNNKSIFELERKYSNYFLSTLKISGFLLPFSLPHVLNYCVRHYADIVNCQLSMSYKKSGSLFFSFLPPCFFFSFFRTVYLYCTTMLLNFYFYLVLNYVKNIFKKTKKYYQNAWTSLEIHILNVRYWSLPWMSLKVNLEGYNSNDQTLDLFSRGYQFESHKPHDHWKLT
jgi:hypothetical protein